MGAIEAGDRSDQVEEDYEEMHWCATFIDNKFYLAHPLALDRLAKLNAEIRLEKNRLMISPRVKKMLARERKNREE